ncbi:hypothetical protein LJC68_04940 [Bacteroidales bacterium OttesenSCG-928-B11]|nr:hypothetical protein [Bacteroidales bacterium OttesenSCG-928-E04]MDL2309002.1 hypothetical protein [Bacteroidales bacterium OttesenSCG-928-C03]MDL2312203.1 hypothetical protein [Bacteroidales bacterium OttesenSCG-928-B11]MDL2326799.1 hypothetical protein [Bacteroidales bacterium OttesenSCG-928-A14]
MEIFDLMNIPATHLERVGGKAKGLHLMAKSGLKIAQGVVVTEIKNEEDVNRLADYYIENQLGKVAVRSSANKEDGADYSNAGQYRTFLNVGDTESFKNAVVGCLSSIDNPDATAYSQYFNQAKSTEMALVIQQMVDAAKAGVCFTVNPSGQKDELLVESVDGLGEALVSGQSEAARFVVKHDDIQNNKLTANGFSETLPLPSLKAICQDSLTAGDYFGMPLDTEWAIDKNGELYWLQARPITTLDEPDPFELDPDWDFTGQTVTTCNISEMMPGAVTPLTISTSVNAIDWGLRKMMVASGVCKNIDEIPPMHCAFSVGNHLFLNLSGIYRLSEYVLGASNQAIQLSICGRILDDEENSQAETKRKVGSFRAAINGVKYLRFLLSRNKARKKLNQLVSQFTIPTKKTAKEQYEAISTGQDDVNLSFLYHYVTSAHSGAMSSALNIVLSMDVDDKEKVKSIIAESLENIDGIESVDILRSLRKIAKELLQENPDIEMETDDQILDYLRYGQGESHAAYQCFIERHGHRAIREAEISSRGWKDDDKGFMAYLRTVLSSKGVEPVKNTNGYNPYSYIDEKYKGAKRKVLRYLVAQARSGVVNRESSKSSIVKVCDKLKMAYRHLAELMVKENIWQDPSLIYFLQHNEIGRLINDGESALVKRALQRKRIYEEQKELAFDDVYYGKPKPVEITVDSSEGSFELQGTPISRGKAKGIARVVKSIEEANQLQKGEIMVAAFTDIGWSPYYCKIEALVTEVGSVLSHGAVVAREYALPLVSNARGATSLIKTGDSITVDGTTGKIGVVAKTA